MKAYLQGHTSLSQSGDFEGLQRDYFEAHSALKTEVIQPRSVFPRKIFLAPIGPVENIFKEYPTVRLRQMIDQVLRQLQQDSELDDIDGIFFGGANLKPIPPFSASQAESFSLPPREIAHVITKSLELLIDKPFRGVVVPAETSCATGTTLLDIARLRIESGRLSKVLLMSFDLVTLQGLMLMEKFGALCQTDAPGWPKVLAKDRHGFGRAEAVTATLLGAERPKKKEPLFVESSFVTSDGGSLVSMKNAEAGLARTIERCLAEKNIRPNQISAIKLHATGTSTNDVIEGKALERIQSDPFSKTPSVAFKSQFGHALNANSLFEFGLVASSLEKNLLMPVLNSTPLDPEIKLNIVQSKIEQPLNKFLCLVMGFGSINGCYILSKEIE